MISNLISRWHAAASRKWLIVAFMLSMSIMMLPRPEGLPPEGQRMLGLLVFFALSFVTEALPVGASFPLVLGWIVFLGIRSPGEAIASFAHDSALFMMGALMIAQVLVRRNLHQRALTLLLQVVPAKIPWLLGSLMAFGALTSAIISDHTVAALLVPVGGTLVVSAGGIRRNPRLAKLLMLSIGYACAIGGMSSPSGGSRNVIMMAYLQDISGVSVSYGQWLMLALPVTIILTPIVGLILYRLYRPEIHDLESIGNEALERMQVLGPIDRNDIITIGIFVLIMVAWITVGDVYGIGLIAITGALVYLIVGLADWEEDYQQINWGIVLLYFAAMSFGRALETSGAAAYLAENVMGTVQAQLGLESGVRLALSSSVFMSFFSQVMSDGPAVALMGPVILESAKLTATSPVLVGISSTLASSFAYMLIIGTPSNAIVYSSGYLEARDFLRAGFWVMLTSLAVLMLVVIFWWGWLGIN